MSRIVQKRFDTLEDFIKGSNNFWFFFRENNPYGALYRARQPYRRFEQVYPTLAADLASEVIRLEGENKSGIPNIFSNLPWARLHDAYEKMSQYVFSGDAELVGDDFLIR